jgi:uncharacterized membrane protein SirB2
LGCYSDGLPGIIVDLLIEGRTGGIVLKSFHITLAYLTVIGFVVRGLWSIIDAPMRRAKWVRVLPHVIDTLLLGIGVIMVFTIGASLTEGWLAAKMIALLGYIGFGIVTMRAGSKRLKIASFVAALACVGYIFAVAFSRSPVPLAAA